MPKKPKRSRLQKLQNSWGKSSPKERADFLLWLKGADAGLGQSGTEADASVRSEVPIASGRYLTAPTITRIKQIMAARGMSHADVMLELGFSPEDRALQQALDNSASLRLAMVAALAAWLGENADVS